MILTTHCLCAGSCGVNPDCLLSSQNSSKTAPWKQPRMTLFRVIIIIMVFPRCVVPKDSFVKFTLEQIHPYCTPDLHHLYKVTVVTISVLFICSFVAPY